MRAAVVLAWLAGLALVVFLVLSQDAAGLAAALALAGWGALWRGLAPFGTLLADTLGWRALLRPAARPPLAALLAQRWIGASINSLLPVAQLGGEFVRARLLSRSGSGGAVAGASVVVDLTAGMATQALFAALGLVLLLRELGQPAGLRELTTGVALFALLLLGFVALQRYGLFALLARPVARLAHAPAWRALAGGAAALDAEIALCYRHGRALARCAAWRGLGWLAGGVELWLAFLVLDRPVGLAQALALESLGQTVRSIGFLIPGGLGLQEGGILLGGVWLGLAPETVLAAALLKRAREIVCGLPGLVAWAYVERPAIRGGVSRS
jgi:putative membrane protein